MLISSVLLIHYDPSKSLLLLCDASQYGVGVLLSQVCNGDEKSVAYASRTLTNAERNYSQLEKEGLALIFRVKKYFTIIYLVEHLPCVRITSRYKPSSMTIPYMASVRIQRWELTFVSYEYTIKYKSGAANSNADASSRLPLPDPSTSEVPIPSELVLLLHLDPS